MLATLNDVLPPARKGRYAVPAFDVREDVMVRAILATAERERSPVVLMCLEPELRGDGMAYLPGLIRAVADYHSVPVVLHLDHATDLDLVRACIEANFSSVMFDGSRLPFDENVARTRQAVEWARPRGITVEAELGFVGGRTLDDKQSAASVLTEPGDVTRFVERTGVDALAVSIGTAHGVYRSAPVLNIERLGEINAVSPVPLVLHGGSGTPVEQVQNAVRNGISKVNLYADLRCAMYRGLKEAASKFDRPDPLPNELFQPIRDALCELVARKMRMVFSSGRAPGPPPAPRLTEDDGTDGG